MFIATCSNTNTRKLDFFHFFQKHLIYNFRGIFLLSASFFFYLEFDEDFNFFSLAALKSKYNDPRIMSRR